MNTNIRVILTSNSCTLDVLICRGTDLNSTFKALCNDTGDVLTVNGWMFSCEVME